MIAVLISVGRILGLKGRLQAWGGGFALALASLALLGLLWGSATIIMMRRDLKIVERDRIESNAKTLDRALEAERSTGRAKSERDRAAEADRARAMEAINAAVYKDEGDPLRAGLSELRRSGSDPKD